LIKHVTLAELRFKISGTGEYNASHVDFVGSNEVLDRQLCNFADVVVTFFVTETRETERRLTTPTVLLGKINRKLVEDFTCVSRKNAEKGAISVHNNKPEALVGFKQFGKCLGMELVVAKI
jgi:hypothetical protein